MVEFKIYAAGLRSPDKLMGLDLELAAINGLHYKVDTLHDIIFVESENPDLSLKELECIFAKLGLKPRFVGQTHSLPQSPSATQLIRP
jgi:hypothetical protein